MVLRNSMIPSWRNFPSNKLRFSLTPLQNITFSKSLKCCDLIRTKRDKNIIGALHWVSEHQGNNIYKSPHNWIQKYFIQVLLVTTLMHIKLSDVSMSRRCERRASATKSCAFWIILSSILLETRAYLMWFLRRLWRTSLVSNLTFWNRKQDFSLMLCTFWFSYLSQLSCCCITRSTAKNRLLAKSLKYHNRECFFLLLDVCLL